MRFGLLGTLEVATSHPFPTTSAKARTVLAVLLTFANRPVPVSGLMAELWGEQLPASAATTLQTYVCQIRKVLAGSPACTKGVEVRDVLLTRPHSYQLVLGVDQLDQLAFDALLREGREAVDRERWGPAAVVLAKALALWRGPAFVDVDQGGILAERRLLLQEQRLHAQELRIEADLHLAPRETLAVELRYLIQRHPLHETLHAQLMCCLQQLGRSAEALAVYDHLHELLGRRLGLEPGHDARLLRAAIRSRADPLATRRARKPPPTREAYQEAAGGPARNAES